VCGWCEFGVRLCDVRGARHARGVCGLVCGAVGRSDVQFDVCGSVCGACGLVWNVVVL
jgi:hypothetical protein